MTDRILRARKRVRIPPSIREGWNDGVLLTLGGKCIAGQDVGVQKQGRRQRERLVRQAFPADLGLTCLQALTQAPGNDLLLTLGLHSGSPNERKPNIKNQTRTCNQTRPGWWCVICWGNEGCCPGDMRTGPPRRFYRGSS